MVVVRRGNEVIIIQTNQLLTIEVRSQLLWYYDGKFNEEQLKQYW